LVGDDRAANGGEDVAGVPVTIFVEAWHGIFLSWLIIQGFAGRRCARHMQVEQLSPVARHALKGKTDNRISLVV
jgi:hypothetical protein